MLLDHQKLEVYRLAREFNRTLEGWVTGWRIGRADLVDQVRRSSSSCMLNIAEGSGEFAPREKIRFYRMARRSANEIGAALDALVDAGIATEEQGKHAAEKLARLVAMLVRLIRSVDRRPT